MTQEQFDVIVGYLKRIAELLELQTLLPEDYEPEGCPHARAVDKGVMGMRPGEKMYCLDCGKTFSRIVEDHNG